MKFVRLQPRSMFSLAAIVFTILLPQSSYPELPSPSLEKRWFFCFGYERTRVGLDAIKKLLATAHNFNGMVLSSWDLDAVGHWSADDKALLSELAAYCAERNIELIPTGFSAGYGGAALGHDRSFAAALPVALQLIARDGRIVAEEAANLLRNGSFAERQGDRFEHFALQDAPGSVSFADDDKWGTCMRLEGFGKYPHGHGRLMQRVRIEPQRAYRFTFDLRTESLAPLGSLKAVLLAAQNQLASMSPVRQSDQSWRECHLSFISQKPAEIGVYVGVWGGISGRLWIDNLHFSQSNDLADIVRRTGTPLILSSRERDVQFVEGEDFEPIRCQPRLDAIAISRGSRIREGERLQLDAYKIPSVQHDWGNQISLCMSNPALYEHWAAQARALYAIFPFKTFLLSMDEIRNGGGCAVCQERQARGETMGSILGGCISRQRAMLKALDPEIEVCIWSDMLDPSHNARSDYFGVVGDFDGSWKHVPRDVTIICWHDGIAEKSLRFFANEGFRTVGAAYYDTGNLDNSRRWLRALAATPGSSGIMFTSWEKQYDLMEAFGNLLPSTQVNRE